MTADRRVPDGFVEDRTTPAWTLETIPPGLLKSHEAGTWAELIVLEGAVEFVEEETDFSAVARAEEPVVIVPHRRHHITLGPNAKFSIRFYRPAET